MTSLRSRDTIENRLQELKNTTIPDDAVELNHRGWNVEDMQRRAKIDILEWVLDDWRSPIDIYRRYRELKNTATTCDKNGDRTQITMQAKTDALTWVMKDNTDDPRTFFERLDTVAEEVLFLENDARSHDHPKADTQIEPVNGNPFDSEYLEEELHEIWHSLRDVRSHMLSGETKPDRD